MCDDQVSAFFRAQPFGKPIDGDSLGIGDYFVASVGRMRIGNYSCQLLLGVGAGVLVVEGEDWLDVGVDGLGSCHRLLGIGAGVLVVEGNFCLGLAWVIAVLSFWGRSFGYAQDMGEGERNSPSARLRPRGNDESMANVRMLGWGEGLMFEDRGFRPRLGNVSHFRGRSLAIE